MCVSKTGEAITHRVENGMAGEPPGAHVAGISSMASTKANILFVYVTEGDYALLCFVPDAKDGLLHIAHGMIHNFKI